MKKSEKFCPRCGEFLNGKTDVCPSCGTHISREKVGLSDVERSAEKMAAERRAYVEQNVRLSANMSAAKREQLEKEAARQAQMAEAQQNAVESQMSKTKAKKLERDKKAAQKKKNQKPAKAHKKPQLFATSTNEDGSVSIDVRDVSFLPKSEIGVKPKKHKIPEKLKWYDIARWADRMLARKKVKKVVNKAATEIPGEISKGGMLVLCILFGYMGAHNFYAKNWRRGLVVLSCFVVSVVVLLVPVLSRVVGVSIGGGFGLVFLLAWIFDLFRIIFNRYRFRSSKMKFIETLDFETRAILGRRYIKKEIEENKLYEEQREQNEQN